MFFDLDKSIEFTADGARVCRSVLPSGVRILSEEIPATHSVGISFSVAVGSRDEKPGQFGSTHFLEHLLFKGTTTRSARDISVAFDSVGGSANAATAKEYTSYYARVQEKSLPLAVDVLADMFTAAVIDPADFKTEKTVILEELAMNEDDPEDVAHEALADSLLPGHELGRPIGGTRDSILAVERDSVWGHYQKHYQPHNLVVTAAGAVRHEDLVRLVTEALSKVGWDKQEATPSPRRELLSSGLPQAQPFRFVEKPVAQANILLGSQSISGHHPLRFALGIMNTVLGGGMSSRLYQKIREERGLAYSTYSYHQGYADAGYFGMYAGCAHEHAQQVLELMQTEFASIARSGISKQELELSLGNISGGLALRYESNLVRMNRLLYAEIGTGEYFSVSDLEQQFQAVTLEQVLEVAELIANNGKSIIAVGEESLANLATN